MKYKLGPFLQAIHLRDKLIHNSYDTAPLIWEFG